jgi:predicted Zn-dependent peptidase
MSQNFRTNAPLAGKVSTIQLQEPVHFKLENKTPVYAINIDSEPVIKIDLVFDAGAMFQSQPFVASLTNKCLQEGTASHTAEEIAETLDFYGAYLRTATTKDDGRITLYCLNRHFTTLLPLLHEVVLRPVFPEKQVATIVKKTRQEFLVNMHKVKFVSQKRFGSLLFGDDHPYRNDSHIEDYDRITRDMLAAHHKKYYAESPFRIVISGSLPVYFGQKLNDYFGLHSIRNDNAAHAFPDPKSSEKQFHLIEKSDSLQSALRIGKVLFNRRHDDFAGMQVVNTILGGYFGSRLMTNIREDKGFTYGIGSMVTSLIHSGMFTIASEVGVDVRQQAVDEVFKEIDRLRNDLVPEDELALVKNYLLGVFLRSADGPFALSELVKASVDYGMGVDYYTRFVETINNITAKEIRELAVKYLDPATMITLIVGK